LGGGCADGLICGGEASVRWVGSCGLMEWLWSFGFGSLHGGGAIAYFVVCFSCGFSDGDNSEINCSCQHDAMSSLHCLKN